MEPVSRIELLAAGVQIEPVSRLEKFVAAAAGTYELPADLVPVSRLEYFLSQIAGGGGGTPGPSGDSLLKVDTYLYMRNVVNRSASGEFNLRPTSGSGNPFNREGFYLRAKIERSGSAYSNSNYHYAVGIGGTINSVNNANNNTIFLTDRYTSSIPFRAGLAFQDSTAIIKDVESLTVEAILTIDSLTINGNAVTLGDSELACINNIADLTVQNFHIGYTVGSNFATTSVVRELEIGAISI